MKAMADREVWFVMGSQDLYGDEVLGGRASTARPRGRSTRRHRSRSGSSPTGRPTDGVDPGGLPCGDAEPDCIGVIVWMHTFSPAECGSPGLIALQKPLLHLHTQHNRDLPWAEIDMDFMNLNQSAHGDREFGYVESRLRPQRTTVVGHWQDPEVSRTDRRLGPCCSRRRTSSGGSGSPASATTCARSRSPRATRSRRRSVSASGSTATASATWSQAVEAASEDEGRPARRRVRRELRHGASLRRRRRATAGTPRSGPDRDRPAHASSRRGGFGAFTDTFEDLGDLVQLPGIAVAAADGRRLRLRCRGRLEDGPARPGDEGHGDRPAGRDVVHGGLHLPPGPGPAAGPGGAHARGLPVDRRRHARRARSIRCRSAIGRTRSDSSSRRDPDRRSSWAFSISATGSGSSSTRSTWSGRPRTCRGCPSPARSGSPGPA